MLEFIYSNWLNDRGYEFMFGRENLIWEYAEEFGDDSLYLSAQADEVMNKMEGRIRELETENETHVNEISMLKAHIKYLETKLCDMTQVISLLPWRCISKL